MNSKHKKAPSSKPQHNNSPKVGDVILSLNDLNYKDLTYKHFQEMRLKKILSIQLKKNKYSLQGTKGEVELGEIRFIKRDRLDKHSHEANKEGVLTSGKLYYVRVLDNAFEISKADLKFYLSLQFVEIIQAFSRRSNVYYLITG